MVAFTKTRVAAASAANDPSLAVELMFEPFRPTVTTPAPAFLIKTTLPADGLAGRVIVTALLELTISWSRVDAVYAVVLMEKLLKAPPAPAANFAEVTEPSASRLLLTCVTDMLFSYNWAS